MINLPDVIRSLITDGLSGRALAALKAYRQRLGEAATEILFDELQRGQIDPAKIAVEDDRVAVIYRYLRASWEGCARENLRLLAKAIAGRLRTNNLVADEFLSHADALASLSRDEIILLATMTRVQSRFGDAPPINELWPPTVQKLAGIGWGKDYAQAIAGRALRSGYVVAASAWDALSFRPSPLLIDLCKTVDFDDALRREGHSVPEP